MSNRTTQKNIPLPVLGSTGWGSNLNSYLRANSYRQSAIEEDLQDLYEQQNNATQTILSSGVMSLNVDTKMPGLYKNTGAAWSYVNDGDEIEIDDTYGYFGYGAVLSNVNVVKQLETTDQTGVDHHVLTIDFSYSTDQYTGLDLQTSTSNYDARCVYAYYDNNNWTVRFATTATPSTETSISIHPQYICLGVVIQFGTKLYWHYKTMKSSLSLSVKKWMLDEPHASLDTYMNFNAGNKTLVPFVVSQTQPTKLHIQALGINPFSVNELITSELNADLFTMDFATKNAEDEVVSNFVILHAYNNGSNIVYNLYNPETTGGVVINNYSSTTKYRICATSLRIDRGSEGNHAYKWVLLLQEAINDSTLNTSLFNDNDFNRLYYYADPVELYRLENSSLHANPGNGISTINANGINPHISTLLKNDDDVFFGETSSDYFHFKTEPDSASGVTRSGVVEVVIPNSTESSPTTSVVLTDNMQAINTGIHIQNTLIGTGSETNVDNKISMRAGRAAKNYHNLSLHSHQGSEGGIMHFTGTGAIKLQAYTGKTSPVDIDTITDAQASIDICSKVDGDASKATIDLKSKYINLYGDTAVVPVTKNFQFNDGTGAFCVVQNYDTDRPKLLLGKTSGKHIALLADGDKATIKVGNLSGGDCTTLSSDGLYLPSGSGGVKINQLLGAGTNAASSTFTIDCSTLSLSSGDVYDSLQSLPSVKNWLEDKIINPWGEPIHESYSDIIWKNIQKISVRLKRKNNTDFYNVDTNWGHWSNYVWRAPSGMSEVRLTFKEDQTILECTAGDYIEVEKIEVTFNFTLFQTPILSVNNFNHGIMYVKSIGNSQGAVLVVDSVDSAGHIYCDTNNYAIRIKTNNSAVTIDNNDKNVIVDNNADQVIVKGGTGVTKVEQGKIDCNTHTLYSHYDKKIFTYGKTTGFSDVSSSVLDFYNNDLFLQDGPIIIIPGASTETWLETTNEWNTAWPCFNNHNWRREEGFAPDTTKEDGVYTMTLLNTGCNSHIHEWIKLSVACRNSVGWCLQTFWALTGAINRYYFKMEDGDKFYMQYGKNSGDSINCSDYFEIDTRRSEWYTSSISSPQLQYEVKLEYAGASGVDLNLDGSVVPDKMKVRFITLTDSFTIYHRLQGGADTNTSGNTVYIGPSKDKCTYIAPYKYCISRNSKIT